MVAQIKIPAKAVAELCRRNHICKLALFGSVLRDDFGPNSDVDVLVDFEPEHVPGFIGLAGLELELSPILSGRRVDMNTPASFRPAVRQEIMKHAMVLYGEGA